MLAGDALGVAQPSTDDVRRELLFKFRLPGRSQVVKQLRPGGQPRPANDPLKLSSQVDRGVPALGHHPLRPFLGFLERGQQVGLQLRKQWQHSAVLAFITFRLGRRDAQPIMLPIHIRPPQRQGFARAAQPTVAGQGHDQSPLGAGARIKHFACVLAGDEELAGIIGLLASLHALERVLVQHLPLNATFKRLAGRLDALTDGGLCQPIALEVLAELLGVQPADLPQRLVHAEVREKRIPRLLVRPKRAHLDRERCEELSKQVGQGCCEIPRQLH
ncbi:MAG TPA: hypothetical protein VIM11_05115 [Tepidisphaeraceae bacterium]